MQKLKKLLNPLNIPYHYQEDILSMIDEDNLSLLDEDDIIEALNSNGKVKTLNLTNQDLVYDSKSKHQVNTILKSKQI